MRCVQSKKHGGNKQTKKEREKERKKKENIKKVYETHFI